MESKVQVWTIQDEAAWHIFKRNGELRATRDYQADEWQHAYAWMRDQMTRRLGPPPDNGVAPLWGWVQWDGTCPRPDLRTLRHTWGPPGQYVMLECCLPHESVLLSDFDAWHIILMNQYLPRSEDDEKIFEAKLKRYRSRDSDILPKALKSEILESWDRAIDMEQLAPPYWHGMDQKSIQGCFWEVRSDQVVSATPFSVEKSTT